MMKPIYMTQQWIGTQRKKPPIRTYSEIEGVSHPNESAVVKKAEFDQVELKYIEEESLAVERPKLNYAILDLTPTNKTSISSDHVIHSTVQRVTDEVIYSKVQGVNAQMNLPLYRKLTRKN
jgi:hypothetical protein